MNERTLNGFIAAAMSRQAPPNYRFTAEQSGAARRGNATPDIIVEMPYGLRTIIETEYGAPAVKDAIARLGYEFNDSNIPMKSVIALDIPRRLGELGHAARQMALPIDDPARGQYTALGNPIKIASNEVQITPPPLLGEHTGEVLQSLLNLDAAAIQALRQSGAI